MAKTTLRLDMPENGGKVLLHACCAPCSGAILECMLDNGIRPAVFFSNSNIAPYDEYSLRLSELRRYAVSLGLEVIDDEYDHEEWLACALETERGKERSAELAKMPERCDRCFNCFRFRLGRAASYAAGNGFGILTTTLASSRWKDLAQVSEAGRQACLEEGEGTVVWWDQNWRKGGLQPRRSEIIKEQGFYNQNWCGCEFSREDSGKE